MQREKVTKKVLSMSKRTKKFYHEDFEKQFNLVYLKGLKIAAPELKKWDIEQDKEFTVNPALNEHYQELYGDLVGKNYCAPMCIKWVNKIVEYGVFAEDFIAKGSMVCEYTGILEQDVRRDGDNLYVWDYPTIRYEEVLTKENKKRRKKILYCVNAQKEGNIARFINHSLRKYQNVDIRIVPHNKLWHVVYIAKKDIYKGQQLLTYYGLDYWKDRNIVPAVIMP